LALIIAGFVLLVTVYSGVTPPFEGPDEAQHFAYIRWLVEENRFPPQDNTAWDTPVEQEASQPPLFYLLASLPARLVGITNPEAIFRPNPNGFGPFPRTFPDNDNRAIHYPDDARPLQGGWLALYLARIVSLLFGVILILAVYGLARAVKPDAPAFALGSALFVACIPQVIFLSSVASNDIPVAAMGTVTLWLLVRMMQRGPSLWLALGLGAAYGLTGLAKVSGLTLGLPIAVGLGWLWWSRRATLRQTLLTALGVGLSALLLGGWWFIRSWLLYGSPLGLQTHDQARWAIGDAAELGVFSHRWWEVFRSFWAWFGWGTVRPDAHVYPVILVIVLLAVVGLGLGLWRWWRQLPRTFDTNAAIWLVLVVALAVVALFLEVWMRRVTAPYGRLLYPAIGPIALLLMSGWRSLHRRLPLLPIALLGFIAVYAPYFIIKPAYARPRPLTPAAVAALPEALDQFFGPTAAAPFAELLSATPLEPVVTDGGIVPVQVCWRTLAPADQDYSVFVQIIGPNNGLLANRRTYPGLGSYPTSTWEPDQVFCDLVQVFTKGDQAITRVYRLEVGLIDDEGLARVPGVDAQGNPLPHNFVGSVKLVAQNQPMLAAPLPADPPVQLRQAQAADTWQRGTTQSFSLEWGVAAAMPADYQVFVHLRDPATNATLFQADGPPLDGWYPTSWWGVGEIVRDERQIHLPDDLAPGVYNLVVGFYDLATGQRVTPETIVTTVEIRP